MLILVAYSQYFGRSGSLDGLFVTTKEQLEAAYGKEVYLGEVLGKHSEVVVKIAPDLFTIKSEDQDFITKVIDLIGNGEYTITGYNPLDYIEETEEEE